MKDDVDVHEWVRCLINEVSEKWERSENKYDFSEQGFRVFDSHVYPCPDLMVIGHFPAVENKLSAGEYDFPLPGVQEKLYHDSKIERKMKYLFEGVDRDEWLEKSVKLNLIFFRSGDEAQWEGMEKRVRDDLETFCFMKVNDIIDTLKPRYIVTKGLKVFDILIRSVLMGCDDPEVKTGVGGRKIYARSRYGLVHIIGLTHLAKDRFSYPDWNDMKKYLKADLKELEQMCLH